MVSSRHGRMQEFRQKSSGLVSVSWLYWTIEVGFILRQSPPSSGGQDGPSVALDYN